MPQKKAQKTLLDAFMDELKDVYNAEKQLTKALPKMAKGATDPQLKKAFESHLAETQGQIEILEKVFGMMGETAKGKHCDGIAGILEEAKSILEEDFDEETMDASLIAAGNRAEHYEIAAYGTLVSWAETLGNGNVAKELKRILGQEEAADAKLTKLGEGGINRSAAVRYKRGSGVVSD
jgi:ferritin-like metal-binding protein YciE